MPAEKSKNSLPSTSVTTMPRPLFRDQRIGTGIGRGKILVIARQHALGVGAGKGGLDLWSYESLGAHGILRKRFSRGLKAGVPKKRT